MKRARMFEDYNVFVEAEGLNHRPLPELHHVDHDLMDWAIHTLPRDHRGKITVERNIHGWCRYCGAYCGFKTIDHREMPFRYKYESIDINSVAEIRRIEFICDACSTHTALSYNDPMFIT